MCPKIGFGLYGSSRCVSSSSVNSILRASTIVRSALCVHEGHLFLTDHFLKVFQLGGANDGGSDFLCGPGKRDLCHLDIMFVGEFLDTKGRRSINDSGGSRLGHSPIDDSLAGIARLIAIKPAGNVFNGPQHHGK